MTNTNKAQFNVKEAKAFRATMAKWADAHGNINERILSKQDFVKARLALIASNKDAINGKTTLIGKTVEEVQAESDKFQAEIDKATEELAEYKKAQSDRVNPALALVTDSMFEAYSAYIMDAENADLWTKYAAEVELFFATNGVVSGQATVSALIAKTGADPASARAEFKTGKTTKAMSKGKFKDLFIRSLCDIMRTANALPEYKYTYVPMKDREQKNK